MFSASKQTLQNMKYINVFEFVVYLYVSNHSLPIMLYQKRQKKGKGNEMFSNVIGLLIAFEGQLKPTFFCHEGNKINETP